MEYLDEIYAYVQVNVDGEKTSLYGNLYFKTGEFKLKNFRLLTGELSVKFHHNNEDHIYPLKYIGGKYFVENQKDILLFSNPQLFDKLGHNLDTKSIVKRNKL